MFMAIIMLFASFAFSACDIEDILGPMPDSAGQSKPADENGSDGGQDSGSNDDGNGGNQDPDTDDDDGNGNGGGNGGSGGADDDDGNGNSGGGGSDTDDDDDMDVYSLSFASVANRTTYNSTTQVWEQNGITFTNNKGSTNIGDYFDPVRLYKNSTVKVEYNGIDIIIFHAHAANYGERLETSLNNASLSGATISRSVAGDDVTITFDTAVAEVQFTASEQIQLDSIDVLSSGPLDPDDGNGGNGGSGGNPNTDPDAGESDLSIHFLELGCANAGDCVLIKSGNTEVLIDAGAKSNTAPTPEMREYVAKYCTDGILEYVIATHAHEDHIAGLVGDKDDETSTGFLYQYKIGTIIQFAQKNTTSKISGRYATAVEYCKTQGTKVYTALECTQKTNEVSAVYYLDEAQTISMTILYQEYYTKNASKENDYSVCMLLTQRTADGEYNALFTGDLEEPGERSLVENNPNLPHCDLFKGGHHGSSTSSNVVLLDKITPDNIAICTCAGTYEYANKPTEGNPNAYLNTFPTQEAINRMAKYTKNIYVTSLGILNPDYSTAGFTSMNGNIVFYYDTEEKTMKLWCSNNTTILKETEWFKANRTWPSDGVQ